MDTGADATVSCSVSSPISQTIIIVYGGIYLILLIIVSVYSYRAVHDGFNFHDRSCFEEFIAWCRDLSKRKRCYIPIIAHIFDQVTDVSVALQFYELAQTKYHNDWAACNGLNMWYLFYLAVSTLVFYRVLSAYLVYHYTDRQCIRLVYQLFDIELYITLYTNYICGLKEPSNPQRWITAMEAVLESTPQALIQLVYLVNTHGFSPTIIVSLLLSMLSIISKLIADDKTVVHEYAKARGFNIEFSAENKCEALSATLIGFCIVMCVIIASMLVYPVIIFVKAMDMIYYEGHEYVDHVKELDRPHSYLRSMDKAEVVTRRSLRKSVVDRAKKKVSMWRFDKYSVFDRIMILERPPLSWFYVLRVIWRALDVTSRLFMMVLIWTIVGGLALSVIIFVEFSMCVVISAATKHWEFLFSVVALAVALGNETKRISGLIFLYRSITNIILLVLIGVWLFIQFECPKCAHYHNRADLARHVSSAYRLFMYCCGAVLVSPILFSILIQHRVFKNEAATSRVLHDMLKSKPIDHDGILERQIYVGCYGVYDEDNDKCLLGLALEFEKEEIIKFLKRQIMSENEKICAGTNTDILDVICRHKDDFDEEHLLCIYKIDKNVCTKSGDNAFWCAITMEKPVGQMIRFDNSLIASKKGDCNILDQYRLTPRILKPDDLEYIHSVAPEITDKNGFDAVKVRKLTSVNSTSFIDEDVGDIIYMDEIEKHSLSPGEGEPQRSQTINVLDSRRNLNKMKIMSSVDMSRSTSQSMNVPVSDRNKMNVLCDGYWDNHKNHKMKVLSISDMTRSTSRSQNESDIELSHSTSNQQSLQNMQPNQPKQQQGSFEQQVSFDQQQSYSHNPPPPPIQTEIANDNISQQRMRISSQRRKALCVTKTPSRTSVTITPLSPQ